MNFNSFKLNFDPDQIEQAHALENDLRQLPNIWWEFYDNKTVNWQYGKNFTDNHLFNPKLEESNKIMKDAKCGPELINNILLGLDNINKKHKKNIVDSTIIFKNKSYIAFFPFTDRTLKYIIPLGKFNPEKTKLLADLQEDIILGNSNHEKLSLMGILGHAQVDDKNFYTKIIGKFKVLYSIERKDNQKIYNINYVAAL